MKYLLVGLIKIYQLMPLPTHSMCRHQPTCSEYTIQSIIRFGSVKGCFLGMKRILRCNPWGTNGYDPIPNLKTKGK